MVVVVVVVFAAIITTLFSGETARAKEESSQVTCTQFEFSLHCHRAKILDSSA